MSLFFSHFRIVSYRNVLLKLNDQKKIVVEILIPVFLVSILIFIKSIDKNTFYNAEDSLNIGSLESKYNLPLRKLETSIYKNNTQNTIAFYFEDDSNIETKNNIMNNIMQDSFLNKKNYTYEAVFSEFPNNFTENDYLAIINFKNDLMTYTIELNEFYTPHYDSSIIGNYGYSRAHPTYLMSNKYLNAISYIQSVIESNIISEITNTTIHYNINVGNLSKPPVSYYKFGDVKVKLYSLYMSFIFIIFISIITSQLIREKRNKLNETFLIYGVNKYVFSLSWGFIYSIITIIASIVITLLLTLTKTYDYINPVLLFITLSLYGISICEIGVMFSTFLKNTRVAGSFACCCFSLVCVIYLCIGYASGTIKSILYILFSQLTFSSFMEKINLNEIPGGNSVHLGFFNYKENLKDQLKGLFKSEFDISSFLDNIFSNSIGKYIIILIFNIILYLCIIFIFEKLFSRRSNYKLDTFSLDGNNNHFIEEDNRDNQNCLINVSNISKIYSKPSPYQDDYYILKTIKKDLFYVFNRISFKVYEDEIFGVLGNSGVGKTVLYKVLSGLIKPSDGEIKFDNVEFNIDSMDIRKDFGVCPQINNFYDELTVKSYVKVYSMVKNENVDCDKLLEEISLEGNKNDKIMSLTENQKRKLCIALAFIGNPKYVFIDEPTAGLDPLSRKKVWDLLLSKKKGRSIILTTSSMEEADIITDRKLILSHNKICCMGTSRYIKNYFNMIYSLDMECKSVEEVKQIVKNHIPESNFQIQNTEEEEQFISSDYQRITWKLPISTSSKFSELFNELESITGEGKPIKNFTLSKPSLEELFYRLVDENSNNTPLVNDNNTDSSSVSDDNTIVITDINEINITDYNSDDATVFSYNENFPEQKRELMPAFEKLKYLIKLRIKIIYSNIDFTCFAIIVPLLFSSILYKFIDIFYSDINEGIPELTSINKNLYNNSIFNIETKKTTIPNFTKDLYSSIIFGEKSYNNVTEYDEMELNNLGKSVNGEPYFISSFSGSLDNDTYNFNINYNATIDHALPFTINSLSNMILASRGFTNSTISMDYRHTELYKKDDHFSFVYTGIAVSLLTLSLILTAMLYGPSIVKEKENMIYRQLQLNGVSKFMYWSSAVIAYSVLNLVSVFLATVPLAWRYSDVFLIVTIFIIILFASILWTIANVIDQLILSHLFTSAKSSKFYISFLNVILLFIGTLIISYANDVTIIYDPNSIFSNTAIIIEIIMTIINPSLGFISIVNAFFVNRYIEIVLNKKHTIIDLLEYNSGMSPIFIALIVAIVLHGIILLSIDYIKDFKKSLSSHSSKKELVKENEKLLQEKDEGLYKEYISVKENYQNQSFSVLNLTKEFEVDIPLDIKSRKLLNKRYNKHYGDITKSNYRKNTYVKKVIDDISFGVYNHECFGLLGPRDSGKSTVLKTIIGETSKTSGKIFYKGEELKRINRSKTSIGYYSREDCFWEDLSVMKHIELFLRLNGYSGKKLEEYSTQLVNRFGFEYETRLKASKLTDFYKRKLCLLIALCSKPNSILLDEPTAGMDSSKKNFIWDILKELKRSNENVNIVLTTNSLEEAVTLCDRFGIIVNGKFEMVGSPETIKEKYKNAYQLEVQSNDITTFHQSIIEGENLLGKDYTRIDRFHDRVVYNASIQNGFGKLFEVLERCKTSGLIKDYSLSHLTMNQMYLDYSKSQIINYQDKNNY